MAKKEKREEGKGEQKFAAAAAAAADVIIDAMGDALMVLDINRKVIKVNKSAVKLWGYTPEEMLEQTFETVFPKKEHKKHYAEMEIGVKTGTIRPFETLILTKDGREIPAMISGTVMKDAEGKLAGFVGVFRDITEIKRAEEERTKAAMERAATLDAMIDGLWVINLQGETVDVNQAMVDMLGYKNRDELVKKNPLEATSEKDREKVANEIQKCFKTGLSTFEFDMLTKDGKEIPMSIKATIKKDMEGKPIGAFAIIRDITELKKAQEEVTETTRKTEKIMDAMIDGVSLVDMNGYILWVNTGCVKMLGFEDKKEQIGKHITELTSERDKPREMDMFKKTFETGSTQNLELILIKKNGEEIPVMLNSTLLKDEKGNTLGVVGVLRDITELKKAQEEATKAVTLREMERIMENMIDGVDLVDMNGYILWVNTGYVKMFGFEDKKELIGKHITEQMSERDNPKAMVMLKKSLEADVTQNLELTLIKKNGKEFPVLIAGSMLKDEKGNTLGAVGVLRDITDVKHIREELQARVKELEDFHDVAVGTELEMAELEGEVERLKKELERVKGQNRV